MKKNAKRKVSPYIYVSAYHNIKGAMSGHRVFDRFGFNLPPGPKKGKLTVLTKYEKLIFMPELYDRVCMEAAEILTGYQPPDELLEILERNINIGIQ
ncbi:MAG: hypothetical protein V9E90_10385 [Saprospiraceae bacterium]